ncbi:MAG: hypothetical protein Sapg2KO_10210 [Saprospiraceae bacterium]
MKSAKLIIFFLSLLFGNLDAQNIIKFQVDLTNEKFGNEVGVRGGFEPLSWSENSIMEDTQSNNHNF